MMVAHPACANTTYSFTLHSKSGKTLVSGRFTGRDANRDGWIDLKELTSFSETRPLIFSGTCLSGRLGTGWRSSFDLNKLPVIVHSLKDLKHFRFAQRQRQGNTFFEYETTTEKPVVVQGLHFWMSTELKEGGKKGAIFSGVGNGSEGIELCEVEIEQLIVSPK
ncbi:hypothetical protein [Microcystis aeruginosa]|uniref:Uncharacterized protein n=1 Tax=Microcystis aeruginosa FD4 TaxID=2686288 RepID=A0A857D1T3_MICAE|nr:hypothetical protein [Microcystis aeruginosa]QGZ89546.1 hypothetical protein GQR42_08195 [Microcystis aeruginosa FD4]